MRLSVALLATGTLALLGYLVVDASASTMSITGPAGVVQTRGTGLAVTNTVRDDFTDSSGMTLDGQLTDFDGGGGVAANQGPAWTADSDWTVTSGGLAQRTTGSGVSVARVPWLTRQTKLSIAVSNYSAGTSGAGLIAAANSSGTTGIAAALYTSSGNKFGLFKLTAGVPVACGGPLSLTSSTAARTVTLTFNPSAGGTATATISGGGGGTVTSTCSLADTNGDVAGMYSNTPSATRYDTLRFTLS